MRTSTSDQTGSRVSPDSRRTRGGPPTQAPADDIAGEFESRATRRSAVAEECAPGPIDYLSEGYSMISLKWMTETSSSRLTSRA